MGQRGFEHGGRRGEVATELGGVVPRVDLDERLPDQAEFAGDPAEAGGEFRRVDRLDDVESLQGLLGLVRLQVADQLPAELRGGLGTLLEGFLHPILADRRESEAMGEDRRLHGVGLGHRKQAHGVGSPAGGRAGLPNPAQDGLTTARELVIGDHLNTSGVVSPPSQRRQRALFAVSRPLDKQGYT